MTQTATVIQFPSERHKARRLVPLKELQEHCGFSARWWRYRMGEGLPVHRWGNRLRFDIDEVERWLGDRYAN